MDSEKLSYSSEELRYYLSHGKFKGRLSNKVTEAELNTIAWEGVYSSYDEIQKSSEYHTVAPTNTKALLHISNLLSAIFYFYIKCCTLIDFCNVMSFI